jgi:hypothetical protein
VSDLTDVLRGTLREITLLAALFAPALAAVAVDGTLRRRR